MPRSLPLGLPSPRAAAQPAVMVPARSFPYPGPNPLSRSRRLPIQTPTRFLVSGKPTVDERRGLSVTK